MKYQHIFFDLDGITDRFGRWNCKFCAVCTGKAGIVPPAREQLLPFVGSRRCWIRSINITEWTGNRACRRSKRTGNILQTGAGRRIPSMRVFRRYKQLKDAGAHRILRHPSRSRLQNGLQSILDWPDILTGLQVLP